MASFDSSIRSLSHSRAAANYNSESGNDSTVVGGTFKIIFMGTGVSTAVPNLGHILADSCDVCRDAHTRPESKNKRNNVSIAIVFSSMAASHTKGDVILEEGRVFKEKCVLIDFGKTMRESCLSLLPRHGIKEVAAIVLTHGHADAILGLDDVRDLQIQKAITISNPAEVAASLSCQCCVGDVPVQFCQVCPSTDETLTLKDPKSTVTGFQVISGPMPVYLHQETMDIVSRTFAYLTQSPDFLDKESCLLSRRIALLKFIIIEQDDDFNICGLPIRSFPVYHGGSYVSLGFSIGKAGEFVYISDVKIIPELTMAYLCSIPRINTLVVDALNRDGVWSHMGLEEALSLVEKLKPSVAYFTGMSCQMGTHMDIEAELARRAPMTHLAYDGLVLDDFEIR